MKNLCTFVFSPADKSSIIFLHEGGDMCFNKTGIREKTEFITPQYLYILSEDDPKEGEWGMCVKNGRIAERLKENRVGTICKCVFEDHNDGSVWKKIIATTNPDLIEPDRPELRNYFADTDPKIIERDIEDWYNSKVPSISQSDIEYIISLYNKDEVYVRQLASETGNDESGCRGFVEGFNKCSKLNADKKFTLEDIKCIDIIIDEMQEADNASDYSSMKTVSALMEIKNKIKFFTKEQLKRDTVIVEYDDAYSAIPEPKSEITWIAQPKLKDGCIVIVRD